ncbi:unnamed protein product [Orchesella dallaii]|uniref:Chitin-binding type-2 domain-containing protein n=1 Tax=Orchesella dallaii TaxID=48710 RepID=A0ABP1QMI8_9HEXA
MNKFLLFIGLCAVANANSPNHHHHHHSPHHHHHGASHHHGHHGHPHGHGHQARPRYYDVSPHIIASPRPRTENAYAQQAHYGPKSESHLSPVQFVGRQSRQESPQLIASASNTPVLVLKKDHSRPVLSSAVAQASKTQQEKEHQVHEAQKQAQQSVPTIVMRNPSEHKQPSPPQPQPQTPVKPPQPKPISVEEDVLSEEEHEPNNVSNASAERRMFFHNVAANGATPKIDSEDEDDERQERIVRSNSNNPYGGGQIPFEYPPQSNYISAGPTRVPVKYQQGVVGVKPHGDQRRPQQRPYKQRIQQAQREGQGPQGGLSEEPLTSEELEEAEEALPDRLTELLATSKFDCQGKKDGYYADDTLNCEVFHYCQDGGKHSWLCPNGFAFHQIHLICVPPSSDNICKQSSNYHFVNEYLYRPVNEKQAAMTNESLKYADRYFPEGYNHGAGDVILPYDDDEEDQPRGGQGQQQHHLRPQQQSPHAAFIQAQQQAQRQQEPQQRPRVSPHPSAYNSNPYNQSPSPRPSPLQHGGFVPSPTPSGIPQRVSQQPHQRHPQQHGHYAQQRAGSSLSPTIIPQHPVSKQGSTIKPSQHGNHGSQNPGAVFFSPESINIPLNQRRPIPNPHPSHHPQIFRPSPQVHRSSSSQPQQGNRKVQYDEEEEY